MPYVLRYDASTGAPNMRVSRASSEARVVQYGDAETNGAEKIRYYFSPFVNEFGLSAVESASQEGQIIVKEGLFGVHAEVRGPSGTQRKILFPIYSGMSYVSGFYTGFTPKISSDRALLAIERVSNGIWRLLNNGGKEPWCSQCRRLRFGNGIGLDCKRCKLVFQNDVLRCFKCPFHTCLMVGN